jgi:signal transduction histidine kinase
MVKIQTTLKLLTEIKTIDKSIIESMDRITINDLYDEKLLLFDENKKLIYASIDDLPVDVDGEILSKLTPINQWVDRKDSLYDVIGTCLQHQGKTFYGISKAYDQSGYLTLNYIKDVLIISFLALSIFLILILYLISGKITQSILHVTRQIRSYNFESNNTPIVTQNSKDEIALLVQRFNELMQRLSQAYLFQKHAVHHISHELKTPIAVLVSNFEKIEKETDIESIKISLKNQKEATKSLGDIINALLEIAKVESGKEFQQSPLRIDELLYDISDEISTLRTDYQISIQYGESIEEESMLTVKANARLLKLALSNLLINCLLYSENNSANVVINYATKWLTISFINHGTVISPDEQQYLFQHFFRGGNSKGKKGFGLGLVMVHNILSLHKGTIEYQNIDNINLFIAKLPLS